MIDRYSVEKIVDGMWAEAVKAAAREHLASQAAACRPKNRRLGWADRTPRAPAGRSLRNAHHPSFMIMIALAFAGASTLGAWMLDSIALAGATIAILFALVIRVECCRTAAETRERILTEIAWIDLVTGLPNRRALEHGLEREKHRSERIGLPLALILFDLDGFKAINDVRGHRVGNAILAATGTHIQSTLRAGDIIVRWGGDEFLVILPDTSLTGAMRLAGRMKTSLASLPLQDRGTGVTASFGLTVFHRGEAITDAIGRADQALYTAKTGGRDRIEARVPGVSEELATALLRRGPLMQEVAFG